MKPDGWRAAELARVVEILARMESADRAFLEPRLLPGWLLRRRRLLQRDELIREARRRFFPERRVTVAAKQLAAALGAHALSGWRWERRLGLPEHASERHKALHAILAAGNGKVIGWRRIAEIFAPVRNRSAVSEADAVEKIETAGAGRRGDSADRRRSRV